MKQGEVDSLLQSLDQDSDAFRFIVRLTLRRPMTSAPRDGTWILVEHTGNLMDVVQWDEPEQMWRCSAGALLAPEDTQHWRHLPPALDVPTHEPRKPRTGRRNHGL